MFNHNTFHFKLESCQVLSVCYHEQCVKYVGTLNYLQFSRKSTITKHLRFNINNRLFGKLDWKDYNKFLGQSGIK